MASGFPGDARRTWDTVASAASHRELPICVIAVLRSDCVSTGLGFEAGLAGQKTARVADGVDPTCNAKGFPLLPCSRNSPLYSPSGRANSTGIPGARECVTPL